VILEVNSAYSSPVYQGLEDIRFKRLATRCERHCVKVSTLVVAVSSPLRDLLASLVPGRADHIIVEPNGANPVRFSSQPAGTDDVRRQLGDGTQLIVGWCGILRDWHGLDLLFRAMRRIEGTRLAIIGDGPDRQRIERVAQEHGVAERTVFTGRVPHAAMPGYIAALDIAVAADDRTGYASPMKVLEYMAAGRAVVAPRLPGLRDIIEDGVDGLLFVAGDEDALAAAITRLAGDTQLRRQLGQRARLKIERERNWQRIAGSVLTTLQTRQGGRATGTREGASVPWREPERTGIARDRSR
jgi:glycosyltransferase involved in cell wall biosynthesis